MSTTTKDAKAIGYIRVSTQRQGDSGLGLAAQTAAINAFCERHGATLVATYREVESGRCNARPELAKALAHAKRGGAMLLIAKLDRLARSVHFISGLMESGVDFRACDLPEANRLLLHVMAAVAENEARAISDRTVAALQAAKVRGVALGAANPRSRNLTRAARLKGAQRAREAARTAYAALLPKLRALRAEGFGYGRIAQVLNADGHATRTGSDWTGTQVRRVLLNG
ncbi:MAG TPA: recombinase family protein [Candidatus Acidoferrales bacterium]|nr:recombinase family protein [Candidatus Acidoferrales bacterium]